MEKLWFWIIYCNQNIHFLRVKFLTLTLRFSINLRLVVNLASGVLHFRIMRWCSFLWLYFTLYTIVDVFRSKALSILINWVSSFIILGLPGLFIYSFIFHCMEIALNLCKQCRPWSDATVYRVWSLSVMIAYVSARDARHLWFDFFIHTSSITWNYSHHYLIMSSKQLPYISVAVTFYQPTHCRQGRLIFHGKSCVLLLESNDSFSPEKRDLWQL